MDLNDKKVGQRNIGKTLFVYLGSAWVFIEAFNFAIDKYGLDTVYLDIIILLVIFGLPASIIYAWFNQSFTRKAILLQIINALIAISVIGYDIIKPDSLHPTKLRLLNFKNNQKKLAQSINSLAILPFHNYSGNSNKDFLAAGVHDALISEIGHVGTLRVISKTSTLTYTNSKQTMQQIASELGVDAIIEGSLLAADDSILLQVKLINAFPDEVQLWTRTYNASLENLMNVYGVMTKNIVNEINIALTPEESEFLAKSKKVDPEAYEAYLKGKYSMGLLSQEGIQAAMGYFQQAIALDNEFAAAYGGLGGIWAFLKQMDFVSADQANPIISENINKALDLDSTLADVHYWNAVKKTWTDFDWIEGEKSFKTALHLNPSFSEARGLFSNFLMTEGRWPESELQMSMALEVDPNNPFIKVLQGMLYMLEEKYDSCIFLYSPMQKNMPTNPLINLGLFISHSQLSNDKKAFEQVKLKLEIEKHAQFIESFQQDYQNLGYQKALGKLANALENQDSLFVAAQSMQYYYALSGNEDKTMDWIEKGFIRKDPDMSVIAIHPLLKPFKNNSRYKEIVNRMNLPLNKYYKTAINL